MTFKIAVKNPDKKQSDPLESKIERTVCKYARDKGFYVRKFVSPANRSVPDDLFINPHGYIFFIEFKRLGKKPTPAQLHEHTLIKNNKADVYIIDNIEAGKALINKLENLCL